MLTWLHLSDLHFLESTRWATVQTKDDLVLALVHHPLAWLVEWDGREVQGALFHQVDVVLRGHLHGTEESSRSSTGGSLKDRLKDEGQLRGDPEWEGE